MSCEVFTLPMPAWATTDAGFRQWGKTWTDLLDVMGYEQVYSNIDWSSVLMPTVAATYAGYRVYRFNDELSGTREVFFKVSFGRGSLTATNQGFTIKIDVGIYHDGEGSVSGYAISLWTCTLNAPSDGGEIFGVKSDLGFSIFTNLSAGTAYQAGFAIERLAENEIKTPDGVVIMLSGSGQTTGSTGYTNSAYFRVANYESGQIFPEVGGVSSSNSTNKSFINIQAIPPTSDPSYATKAPAMLMDTFGKYDPCYHWVFAARSMYSPASEFQANLNGSIGRFRIPATGFLGDNGAAANANLLVAMRVV